CWRRHARRRCRTAGARVGLASGSSAASALRVLRSLAGLLQPVLLALLLPVVAREQTGSLEGNALIWVELGQGPGDAEAERAGLAGDAPAVDGGIDVVGLGRGRDPQGLGHDRPVGRGREVVLDRTAVDHDLALARAQPHA